MSPAQAKRLSAQLASRMKRLLSQMGAWQEAYWQEYQYLMQRQGVWEGEAWLEKWRAHRSGKQIRGKTGQDDLTLEAPKPVPERPVLQRQDCRKRVAAPPELEKVLQALAEPERLQALMIWMFDSDWERSPAPVRDRIEHLFIQSTDLDTLKAVLTVGLEPVLADQAKALFIQLEWQIHRLAALMKEEPWLSYPNALAQLQEQHTASQHHRRNVPTHPRSPAAHYARYR
jgi:hypothetical protein